MHGRGKTTYHRDCASRLSHLPDPLRFSGADFSSHPRPGAHSLLRQAMVRAEMTRQDGVPVQFETAWRFTCLTFCPRLIFHAALCAGTESVGGKSALEKGGHRFPSEQLLAREIVSRVGLRCATMPLCL